MRSFQVPPKKATLMWYADNHQHYFHPDFDYDKHDDHYRFDAIVGRVNNEGPTRIVVWNVANQEIVWEGENYREACRVAEEMAKELPLVPEAQR